MKTTILLLIVGLASTTAVHAEVHKWVDENGNVHFTDTPPPRQKTEEVKIQRAATPVPGRNVEGTDLQVGADDSSAEDKSNRDLCVKAVRNLRKFAPVWERKVRAKMPGMSDQDKRAAQQALVEMKSDINKMKSNMNECTQDMRDSSNRSQAECMANAPNADTAMFCVL